MKLRVIICCLAFLPGCGTQQPDTARLHDSQIIHSWMPDRERADAIHFLQSGGLYESLNFSEESGVDRDHVLPLLLHLQAGFDLKPEVLLDAPRIAFAVVIDVSAHQNDRSAIVEVIRKADERFSGVILDKWGLNWLSLDFLDTNELKPLEEAGALEPLLRSIAEERESTRAGSQ